MTRVRRPARLASPAIVSCQSDLAQPPFPLSTTIEMPTMVTLLLVAWRMCVMSNVWLVSGQQWGGLRVRRPGVSDHHTHTL